jgi:hypothetical protein
MLRGQWTGPFAGSGSGEVIIEFDEVDGQLVGNVAAYSSQPSAPSAFVWAAMPTNLQEFDQRLPLLFIDFRNNEPVEADRIYFFRGHSDNHWRLRTYFHRTGRANLRRFMMDDIPSLHRLLSGQTTHFFDLANPIENGAFYALAQHHGYPTPLLDWTRSPFVAAYFAYRGLPREKRTDQHRVRIVMLDVRMWRKLPQFSILAPARRHLSIFAPLGIDNTRMVPQQAYLTISNVDDIEGYIDELEESTGGKFLQVIDLPGSERRQVMNELAMMGITAGSMFPGLDGACEQLREQNFEL